jgi:flagellin
MFCNEAQTAGMTDGSLSILSLTAQRIGAMHRLAVSRSLMRIATGSNLNSASDGPAEMIASLQLGADLAALNADAITTQRSGSIAAVADGALSGVSDLLTQARTLLSANANSTTSTEEKQANQIQFDAIMNAIDRVGTTTEFAGVRLFSGTLTLNAGMQALDLDPIATSGLGQTAIDGETYYLSDLASGQALNIVDDPQNAQIVLDAAASEINTMRQRIGLFQSNAVEPHLNQIATRFEMLSAAASQIGDTDLAAETSRLIRSRLLEWSTNRLVSLMERTRSQATSLLNASSSRAAAVTN